MMNGGPISWKSCRQDNVFLSTSEAQFVAASQAAQKAFYLRETLKDFGFQQNLATEIYEHSMACVAMIENPVRRKNKIQCAANFCGTWTSAAILCAN